MAAYLVGLVLLDIPQLAKQWDASDLVAREEAAVQTLRDLAGAIQTYNRAWGKSPRRSPTLGRLLPTNLA